MSAPEELPSSSSALALLPTSAWPGLSTAQFSAVPFRVGEGSHATAWWLRGLLCRPRSPRPAGWASVLLLDPFPHAQSSSDLQALCLRAGQVLVVGGSSLSLCQAPGSSAGWTWGGGRPDPPHCLFLLPLSIPAGPWMAGCRCPTGRGSRMSSTAACGGGPTCTATTSYGPWSSVSSPST